MLKLSIYPPAILQVQGGENVGPHLLLNVDLWWDLDLQRNLKYLSWQYIFPAMEIVFSFCMHRAAKTFKHSFLKHCFINIQYLQLASGTMTFYVVHPTVNLSIVYVTVCYLFMLLLLSMQLHDWLPDRKQPLVLDIDAGVRVQHWLNMLSTDWTVMTGRSIRYTVANSQTRNLKNQI